jgi:COMPASS component SPP1
MADISSSTFKLKAERVSDPPEDKEDIKVEDIGDVPAATKNDLEPKFSAGFPSASPSSTPALVSQLPGLDQDESTTAASTEGAMGASQLKHKKKGMASTVKKAPKRNKTGAKQFKKAPTEPGVGGTAVAGAESTDEESDNGPYCICRGPDDHRWMIQCDACEDWFHGECVNLDKDTGENLVEKFVCPNCSDGRARVTRYKMTCSLERCRKPARIYSKKDSSSVFCSAEHCHVWWERQIAELPRRTDARAGTMDQLTQEDFMGLLDSSLADIDEKEGTWKVATRPFRPVSKHKSPREGMVYSVLFSTLSYIQYKNSPDILQPPILQ